MPVILAQLIHSNKSGTSPIRARTLEVRGLHGWTARPLANQERPRGSAERYSGHTFEPGARRGLGKPCGQTRPLPALTDAFAAVQPSLPGHIGGSRVVPARVQKADGDRERCRSGGEAFPSVYFREICTLSAKQGRPRRLRHCYVISAGGPMKRRHSKPRGYQKPKRKRFMVRDDFLGTYEWRRLRMEVLKERGARCECCGASPHDGVTVLNVDHIKPRLTFPELAMEKSNLQVLCSPCNHGKGNWDDTDWR